MIYEQFDIVKVPFPFTDTESTKVRPAVVISCPDYAIDNNHYILAMITSAKQSNWVNDVIIQNLEVSGLAVPSKIRFKVFSLDERLIIGKLGKLQGCDIENLRSIVHKYLSLVS